MIKLAVISAVVSLVAVPRLIEARQNDIISVKPLKIACHVLKGSMHCFQTGKFPRFEWALWKNKLTVWRTPHFGAQAETLFEQDLKTPAIP